MNRVVIAGLFVIIFGCAGPKQSTSTKIEKDGTLMLFGKISREQLFFDYPDWQIEYDNYLMDSDALQELQQIDYTGEVFLFLGTWCSDSRREVPRFFKILDQSGFTSGEKIQIWAVDRGKKLADNLTDTYDIYYVPTIIFLVNGKERGRIIERPEQTLERDILNILSEKP